MYVANFSNGYILGGKVMHANTFFTRLRGLMLRKRLDLGEGLLLHPCNAIHTFGMQFSIDVIFLSRDKRVLHLLEHFKPNRISPVVKNAVYTLELPSGTINNTYTKIGHSLKWY